MLSKYGVISTRNGLSLDPHQNIYYELAESHIPANAYEIRRAFLHKGEDVLVKSADGSGLALEEDPFEVYEIFVVSLRSDLFRHPRPLTIRDRLRMFLFFRDQFSHEKTFQEKKIPYSHVTERLEDLYYDCNKVRIEYTILEAENSVYFEFFTDHSMANFKNFQVSLDAGKTWQPSYGYFLIHGGGHDQEIEMWVTPINMYNRHGSITKVFISLK